MSSQSEDDDEESLAIRMMDRDPDALRLVLKRHLVRVRGLLQKIYPFVQAADIEDAIVMAAAEMWDKADQYDRDRAELGAWFFVIAQSRLRDILAKQKVDRARCRLVDPTLHLAKMCSSDDEDQDAPNPEQKRLLEHMAFAIEKLAPLQKAIVLEDLAVGGSVDAGSLAERLGTTKESIYVSRNKAHENIRKRVLERERRGETLRGK